MQTFEMKSWWQNAKQKKWVIIAKFNEWNGRPELFFDIVEIDEVSLNSIDNNNEDPNDYEFDFL